MSTFTVGSLFATSASLSNPLPVTSGGTGSTTSTGTGAVVKANSAVLTSPIFNTPTIGDATGNSVTVTGVLSGGTLSISGGVTFSSINATTLTLTGSLVGTTSIFSGTMNSTTINNSGTFSTTGAANCLSTLGVASTTASTSPTTGALIVAGGVGVGGYITCAGGVTAPGGLRTDGTNYFGYTQGSWTPTLIMAYQTGETKSFTIGYNTVYGRYEKVGTQVTVNFYLNCYIYAPVGQVPKPSFFNIGGLPFQANDSSHSYFDFELDSTKDTSLYALTGAPGVITPYYPGPFFITVNENNFVETLVLNPLGTTPLNVGSYTYDGYTMAVWGLQTNDLFSGDIVENNVHIPTSNIVSGGINYQVVFAATGMYYSN